MSKTLRTIATAICALFLLPLSAQEKGDTVYTFRFVSDRDMFYVPYSGNDTELARLEECIGNHRTDILDGKLPRQDRTRRKISPCRRSVPTA